MSIDDMDPGNSATISLSGGNQRFYIWYLLSELLSRLLIISVHSLQYVVYHQQCRSHNKFPGKRGKSFWAASHNICIQVSFLLWFETIVENGASGSEVVHLNVESSFQS